MQAYAPLARGAYLDNDILCVLGTKYAHTPAQVGLRWAVQKGISVIPKSVHPDRIASNARIFDFEREKVSTNGRNFRTTLCRLRYICVTPLVLPPDHAIIDAEYDIRHTSIGLRLCRR